MYQGVLREHPRLNEDLIQYCILPYLLPSKEGTKKKMRLVNLQLIRIHTWADCLDGTMKEIFLKYRCQFIKHGFDWESDNIIP